MTMRKRKVLLEVVFMVIDIACVAYTKRKRQREGDKDA